MDNVTHPDISQEQTVLMRFFPPEPLARQIRAGANLQGKTISDFLVDFLMAKLPNLPESPDTRVAG